jgi:hypothetical protein
VVPMARSAARSGVQPAEDCSPSNGGDSRWLAGERGGSGPERPGVQGWPPADGRRAPVAGGFPVPGRSVLLTPEVAPASRPFDKFATNL